MSATPDNAPVQILLAEDDETDVKFIIRAFERVWKEPNIHVVNNGEEALAFLYRQGEYADSPRPDLILLDLNMPRKNGFEVLEEVKKSEELKHIPIVILTTSDDEESIRQSYGLHANSYITKPTTFEELQRVVQMVVDYWMGVSVMPRRDLH